MDFVVVDLVVNGDVVVVEGITVELFGKEVLVGLTVVDGIGVVVVDGIGVVVVVAIVVVVAVVEGVCVDVVLVVVGCFVTTA